MEMRKSCLNSETCICNEYKQNIFYMQAKKNINLNVNINTNVLLTQQNWKKII